MVQVEGSTGALSLRQPVDREERELYRLTIRLSDTLHTTDITQILLVSTVPILHTLLSSIPYIFVDKVSL